MGRIGTLFLFSVPPYFQRLRGKEKEKEMINQKFYKNHDRKMAEKCKKALEKSYGTEIPLPKCLLKKAKRQKPQTFMGRKNVQK
jgi:hypothetical protein